MALGSNCCSSNQATPVPLFQPAGVRLKAFRNNLGEENVSVWMENLFFLSLVKAKALNLKLIY